MSTGIEKNETDSHEGKTERTTPSKERRVFQSSTTKCGTQRNGFFVMIDVVLIREKKNERKGMQLPTKAPSVEALWENLREKEREKIKRTKTASSPTVRWNQSFGESSLPVGASESRSLQNEEFLTILDKTKAAIHADLPKTMPKASDSKVKRPNTFVLIVFTVGSDRGRRRKSAKTIAFEWRRCVARKASEEEKGSKRCVFDRTGWSRRTFWIKANGIGAISKTPIPPTPKSSRRISAAQNDTSKNNNS